MAQAITSNSRFREFLEDLYEQELSEAEILEYKNNLVSFFSLLIEIDQRNKRKSNEQNL